MIYFELVRVRHLSEIIKYLTPDRLIEVSVIMKLYKNFCFVLGKFVILICFKDSLNSCNRHFSNFSVYIYMLFFSILVKKRVN